MYCKATGASIVAVALLATAANLAWATEAEDQFAVAADHYAHQRWQLAAEELRVFLDGWPDHAKADDALFFTAEALVQLGQYAEAHAVLGEFLSQAADHRFARQALFRSGETAYLNREYTQAKHDLRRFHRAYPDDPLNAYAQLYLGEMSLRVGDVAGAQLSFQDALQRADNVPISDRCRFGLARALELQGDLIGAARFYRMLADAQHGQWADKAQLQRGLLHYNNQQYTEAARALEAFETTFRDSPLRVQAGYWLGMTHIAQLQWTEAAQTLVRFAPDDPRHELAPAIEFATAEALRRAGKASAADHYERVAQRWPDSQWADDALRQRVDMALQNEQYDLVDTLAATFGQRFADSPLHNAVRRARGRSLLKRERYDEAATLLESLVESLPDDNSNWYYLSLAYLAAKRYHESLSALERVEPSQQQPQLAAALLVARSATLVGLERYAEAVAPLQQYLTLEPNGEDAPSCRARLAIALAQSGQFDQAREAYAELSRQHVGEPLVVQTTEYLAETAYAKGQRQWAEQLFNELAQPGNSPERIAKGQSGLAWLQFESDHPQQSAETFARLLQQYPDSPLAAEAALARAAALEELQQYDGALAMYHLVIDKHAQAKQAPKAMRAAAALHARLHQEKEAATLYQRLADEYAHLPNYDALLYQWAWVLVDLEQPDRADAVFARIEAKYPQSRYWGDAVYRLAQRAVQDKDYQRAGLLAQRLIDSDSTVEIRAHALYMKGQLAATEKRWPEVVQSMRQLLESFSDCSLRLPAEYWLAEAHYRQRDYESAAEQFDELLRKIHGRSESWLAMVPLRKAQLLARRKKWQQAYDLAVTVGEQYEDFKQQYEVDYLLGRCLASRGEFDEARAAYRRVVRSDEGGATETAAMAQWMIGETFFHQKRFDEAVRAYHRVESLYDYPQWQGGALLQAGKCRETMGQWSEAIQLYRQVLKDYGDTTFADQASRRLRVATQRAATVATPN